MRNRDNLKAEQAIKLEELLAANQPLATVYLLKAELKEIWYAPSVPARHSGLRHISDELIYLGRRQ